MRDALKRFERNELSVTRQARCHPGQGHEIDLLFSLNGIPVATCELKNPMTGQTWKSAIRQYQQDRNPNAPLFRFQKRAPRPLRGRHGRSSHDHKASGRENALPPVQSGQQPRRDRMRRRQPTEPVRISDKLFLARCAGQRAVPRHHRLVHLHRDARGEDRGREGRTNRQERIGHLPRAITSSIRSTGLSQRRKPKARAKTT